ncbi:hypothetical protein [Proteus faecis]|uniref:hypothetical protein n=1 Tax=Proteus faecis TaxID=2050967 RepID=UPI003075BAD1
MSDKGDNCLIFVLKWSFIIILFTTVFLLGFSFIYYSDIDTGNKTSSFFSFLSLFGIAFAYFIYRKQKNDAIEIEYRINKRVDVSISKILLMECQRIGYDCEFMQKSYLFLIKNKLDNPEVKKDGNNYYVTTSKNAKRTSIKHFYKIDASKLMEALRLAVNHNSAYFDTIYEFIDTIEYVNTNLDNWLFNIDSIYQENNIYNMSLNNLNIIIDKIYH